MLLSSGLQKHIWFALYACLKKQVSGEDIGARARAFCPRQAEKQPQVVHGGVTWPESCTVKNSGRETSTTRSKDQDGAQNVSGSPEMVFFVKIGDVSMHAYPRSDFSDPLFL